MRPLLKISEALVYARKGITTTTENPLSYLLTSFDMTYNLVRTKTLTTYLSFGQSFFSASPHYIHSIRQVLVKLVTVPQLYTSHDLS